MKIGHEIKKEYTHFCKTKEVFAAIHFFRFRSPTYMIDR